MTTRYLVTGGGGFLGSHVVARLRALPGATVFAPRSAVKGRGTVWAIEHRFTSESHEAFDDGWGTVIGQLARLVEVTPAAGL